MGGYSFQLEYSIFSPKSKVHFMQPILKRVGCFFIDRRTMNEYKLVCSISGKRNTRVS